MTNLGWKDGSGPMFAVLRGYVGGPPDLPAGGHEEDTLAITERDRIC
jgi:hypothetical protein